MEKIRIRGGVKLCGEVSISGAKNAALAILPAALLAGGKCRIENVPLIGDVERILKIMQYLGADVRIVNKNTVIIDSSGLKPHPITHEFTKHLRASAYFLGALMSRFGFAEVAMPGGCDFGVRPIDQHLRGFEMLGAVRNIEGGIISLSGEEMSGASIYMDTVSVGATVNVLFASLRAQGMTVIENAAKEPHIVDVANFLNAMGAHIRGAGTDVIKIKGGMPLFPADYSIIPDQIEAGTYMVAAAATGGDVLIQNIIPKHLESISAKLEEAGVTITEYDDAVRITADLPLRKTNVKTMPHPGFPTDMQPQIVALLSAANGTSLVTEDVWDNRFKYVEQLSRMGAQIQVDGKIAVIEGVGALKGSPVCATDLRAGAALIIAGLAAEGETFIEDIYHIERGYEDIVGKLKGLGADITVMMVPDKQKELAV